MLYNCIDYCYSYLKKELYNMLYRYVDKLYTLLLQRQLLCRNYLFQTKIKRLKQRC